MKLCGVIQTAQIKLPEDRRALVLAQGYEMLGDEAQAEQSYQSALTAAPQSFLAKQQLAAFYVRTNRSDQAKKYLNEILASTPQLPVEKDCYAWARRMTAELLAERRHVFAIFASDRTADAARWPGHARRFVYPHCTAFQTKRRQFIAPGAAVARRAEERCGRSRGRNGSNLALLYERVGDWPNARTEMQSLLAIPNADPSVFVTYIEMQLRRGTPGAAAEAANWMNSLQSSGSRK